MENKNNFEELIPEKLADLKTQAGCNSLAAKQAYINGLEQELFLALLELNKYRENSLPPDGPSSVVHRAFHNSVIEALRGDIKSLSAVLTVIRIRATEMQAKAHLEHEKYPPIHRKLSDAELRLYHHGREQVSSLILWLMDHPEQPENIS